MRRGSLFIWLPLISAMVACSDRPAISDSAVIVRDSAGIVIVENGDLNLSLELLAATDPSLEIGVVEGAEDFQLFDVTDAKRLSDGGFAVANGGSSELKIFNADGTHRATSGGPGRGPSEFGYPIAITVLPGDTILVQDRVDRVYFTSAGTFVRRESTDRQGLAALAERLGGVTEDGEWMADGTFVATVVEAETGPPSAGPLFRPTMTMVRTDRDLQSADTLGMFGGILQQFIDVGAEWPTPVIPPYPSTTSWELASTRGLIVAADNALPQLEWFAADGAHIIARWNSPPEQISTSEVEEWKDEQRQAPWAQRRLPVLERAWISMALPDSKPHYGNGAVGSDGVVWLGPKESDGVGWMAFSPEGRFIGVASLPAAFTPHDSGPGWVMGIYRNELDVQFLHLYALVTRQAHE